MTVDWAAVRADFPVLRREIDGAPIVYLDSGNTSQKPRQVIEAMDEFLRTSYAPINRSAYRLAGEATDRFEAASVTSSISAGVSSITLAATDMDIDSDGNVGAAVPERLRDPIANPARSSDDEHTFAGKICIAHYRDPPCHPRLSIAARAA